MDSGEGKKLGIIRRLDNRQQQRSITPPEEKDLFYYHGDHLGSSNMITDVSGEVYQHLEYFPYGETWIEEGGSYGGNTPGYKFTGKELDPETGLYYYGARYYDPVLSRWISADPILSDYLDIEKLKILNMGDKGINNNEYGAKLLSPLVHNFIKNNQLHEQAFYWSDKPGVYRPSNLHLYEYTFNNPMKNKDPNGLQTVSAEVNIEIGPIAFGIGLELSPNDFTITSPASIGAPAHNLGGTLTFGFNPESHAIGPKEGTISESVNAGIYYKDFSAGTVFEKGKPVGYEASIGASLFKSPIKGGAYANAEKTKTTFSLSDYMRTVETEIYNIYGAPLPK